MTKKLSTLEFERFAVDGDHHPEFMLRSTWTIVGVADSATIASFQGAIRKAVYAGTQPHFRSATFAAVWVAIDAEVAFDLR
ncbi:hypothetical protein S83_068716 [Arachis hypogaea]